MKTQHVIIIGLALALALTIGILIGVLGGRGDSGGSGQKEASYQEEPKSSKPSRETVLEPFSNHELGTLQEDMLERGKYRIYSNHPRKVITSLKGKLFKIGYNYENMYAPELAVEKNLFGFYPDGRFIAFGIWTERDKLYATDVLVGTWKDDNETINIKYYIKHPDSTMQVPDRFAVLNKQIILKAQHKQLNNELHTAFRATIDQGNLRDIDGYCDLITEDINDDTPFSSLIKEIHQNIDFSPYNYNCLQESSTRPLSLEELRYFSPTCVNNNYGNIKENLSLLRNSIFARNRYKFKRKDLAEAFEGDTGIKNWARYANVDDLLTPLEKENIKKIQKIEINAPVGASR